MTGTASVVMACTAVAEDNGMRALRDVAAVAADIEYRVIGGHMVRLLRHVYNVPGIPRLTSDADTRDRRKRGDHGRPPRSAHRAGVHR